MTASKLMFVARRCWVNDQANCFVSPSMPTSASSTGASTASLDNTSAGDLYMLMGRSGGAPCTS